MSERNKLVTELEALQNESLAIREEQQQPNLGPVREDQLDAELGEVEEQISDIKQQLREEEN